MFVFLHAGCVFPLQLKLDKQLSKWKHFLLTEMLLLKTVSDLIN